MADRNPCGPYALAAALTRLGRPCAPSAAYAAHPPDTPFALLGTTPWGLAASARLAGLRAERAWSVRPEPERLARGEGVAIVCVDLRPLGARWPAAHWALVDAADDEGVALSSLASVGAFARRYPWATFLRAWRLRWAPHPAYWHASVRVSG